MFCRLRPNQAVEKIRERHTIPYCHQEQPKDSQQRHLASCTNKNPSLLFLLVHSQLWLLSSSSSLLSLFLQSTITNNLPGTPTPYPKKGDAHLLLRPWKSKGDNRRVPQCYTAVHTILPPQRRPPDTHLAIPRKRTFRGEKPLIRALKLESTERQHADSTRAG